MNDEGGPKQVSHQHIVFLSRALDWLGKSVLGEYIASKYPFIIIRNLRLELSQSHHLF